MLNWLLAAALAVQADALPPPAAIEPPPPPGQVLAVPEELRTALHARIAKPYPPRRERLQQLVDFMFAPGGMGIQYSADATHTVAESWQTRQANCLAFTLLTIALARELDLPAYGQEIERVLSSEVAGNVLLQSSHVNAGIFINGGRLVVDVASNEVLPISPPRRISDRHLLALFYNNRAMQFLVDGRTAEASAWLDAALDQDTTDPTLWNNAGVVSLRTGDPASAERLFLKALKKNPRQPAALYNIVSYYQHSGDAKQAARWQARAERVMRNDPVQQFALGLQSERAGDYTEAVRRFRQAIAMNRDEQLFHFGLARAYLGLGQLQLADSELVRAHDLASDPDRVRYQAKLDALRRMPRR